MNPSERVWRFELRRDVRFHDGRPFSSRDVVHAVRRGLGRPESWLAAQLPLVSGVRALDDHTVELDTRLPAPLLLTQLAQVRIFPAGLDAELPSRAVGTGPYRLASLVPRREIVLERVRAPASGPSWERAVLRFDPDGAARLESLRRGDADLIEEPRTEDLETIEADARLRLLVHPALQLAVLGLRARPETESPFAHPEVRRALALAIDRRALVRDALHGRAQVANQLAAPGVFGHDREFPAAAERTCRPHAPPWCARAWPTACAASERHEHRESD